MLMSQTRTVRNHVTLIQAKQRDSTFSSCYNSLGLKHLVPRVQVDPGAVTASLYPLPGAHKRHAG